jgi:hypothetical protein
MDNFIKLQTIIAMQQLLLLLTILIVTIVTHR